MLMWLCCTLPALIGTAAFASPLHATSVLTACPLPEHSLALDMCAQTHTRTIKALAVPCTVKLQRLLCTAEANHLSLSSMQRPTGRHLQLDVWGVWGPGGVVWEVPWGDP